MTSDEVDKLAMEIGEDEREGEREGESESEREADGSGLGMLIVPKFSGGTIAYRPARLDSLDWYNRGFNGSAEALDVVVKEWTQKKKQIRTLIGGNTFHIPVSDTKGGDEERTASTSLNIPEQLAARLVSLRFSHAYGDTSIKDPGKKGARMFSRGHVNVVGHHRAFYTMGIATDTSGLLGSSHKDCAHMLVGAWIGFEFGSQESFSSQIMLINISAVTTRNMATLTDDEILAIIVDGGDEESKEEGIDVTKILETVCGKFEAWYTAKDGPLVTDENCRRYVARNPHGSVLFPQEVMDDELPAGPGAGSGGGASASERGRGSGSKKGKGVLLRTRTPSPAASSGAKGPKAAKTSVPPRRQSDSGGGELPPRHPPPPPATQPSPLLTTADSTNTTTLMDMVQNQQKQIQDLNAAQQARSDKQMDATVAQYESRIADGEKQRTREIDQQRQQGSMGMFGMMAMASLNQGGGGSGSGNGTGGSFKTITSMMLGQHSTDSAGMGANQQGRVLLGIEGAGASTEEGAAAAAGSSGEAVAGKDHNGSTIDKQINELRLKLELATRRLANLPPDDSIERPYIEKACANNKEKMQALLEEKYGS